MCVTVAELKSAVGEIHVQDKSVLAVDLNKVLVPPHFNKYVAWGFSDMSLRIGNYDSEKVRRRSREGVRKGEGGL